MSETAPPRSRRPLLRTGTVYAAPGLSTALADWLRAALPAVVRAFLVVLALSWWLMVRFG